MGRKLLSPKRFRISFFLIYLFLGVGVYAGPVNTDSIARVKEDSIQHLLDSIQQSLLDSLDKLFTLQEVVVTAEESMTKSSASVVNKEAMQHLQPSSFSDIVSMLPGATVNDPSLNQANTIHLREATPNSNDEYSTTSLGTSFVVDGTPISTNSNLQYVQSSTADQDNSRSTVNSGVDMRSISTDDIEKVEIIRGIASAEYGEVTSGVVKIERTIKPTPWKARFKADGFSKLFYVGKGLGWKDDKTVLNIGVDYLNAKSDPTNSLENYQRITASVRLQNKWATDNNNIRWQTNFDYTGSIDNDKVDPDINRNKEDSYKSQYNKLSWANIFNLTSKTQKWWAFNLNTNITYSIDKIQQTKLVSQTTNTHFILTMMEDGYSVSPRLPFSYIANHLVEGKPFDVFIRPRVTFHLDHAKITQKIAVGVEWLYNKNFGRGQVYDMTRPLNYETNLRPRAYYDIPAMNQLAWYVQDEIHLPVKKTSFDIDLGLRGVSLLGIGSEYSLNGRVYLDPRFNISYNIPVKQNMDIFLSASCGQHTKMPTLLQLYPNKIYLDLKNPKDTIKEEDQYVNTYTRVIDPANTDLKPARNFKWEVRAGFDIKKHKFSITYFQENMKNGFRSTLRCIPIEYALENKMTLKIDTINVVRTYSVTTNGSQIKKEGIEWQYQSPRINAIATRFTVNGAWLKTTYQNSQQEFSTEKVSGIDSKTHLPIKELYVGLYDWNDGSVRQRVNTNIVADVHIKKIGFTVSATFEMDFYVSNKAMYKNGTPIAYMDSKGVLHPYTEQSAEDKTLKALISTYNSLNSEVPFAGYLNLRVQKTITKYATIALFVNKLLDVLPDYTSDGNVIHRSASPYFGMEINISADFK